MKRTLQSILKQTKGVTIADLSIAVVIISIFTGVIGTLLYKNYYISTEIVNSANVNAYATLIMEKVDEKAYEEITGDFVENLMKEVGGVTELEINEDDYTVVFAEKELTNEKYLVKGNAIFKQVTTTVYYHKGKLDEKKITLSKIKVKEMGSI